MAVSWGQGCGGDVAIGGNAEADGLVAAGKGELDLGELVVRGGEADLEPFGFAGPALAFGLGYAGQEVVADAGEPTPLGGVDPQERAPDAPLTEPTERPYGLLPRSTDSDSAISLCPVRAC